VNRRIYLNNMINLRHLGTQVLYRVIPTRRRSCRDHRLCDVMYIVFENIFIFWHWKWPAQGTSTVPIVSAHFRVPWCGGRVRRISRYIGTLQSVRSGSSWVHSMPRRFSRCIRHSSTIDSGSFVSHRVFCRTRMYSCIRPQSQHRRRGRGRI